MKKIYFLFLCIFISINVNSQSIDGTKRVCPGSSAGYLYVDNSYSGNLVWKITGGKIQGSVNEICGTIKNWNIVWDSNFTTGKIQIYKVPNCNSGAQRTLLKEETVSRYRFTSPYADNLCAPNSYPQLICGSSQTLNLKFYLPYNADINDYELTAPYTVDNGSVSLPQGWSLSSVNLGSTLPPCSGQPSQRQVFVNVVTDGLHSGDVKFRVKSACGGSGIDYYGEWSSPLTFNFPKPDISSITTFLSYCSTDLSRQIEVNSNIGTEFTYSVSNGFLLDNNSTSYTTTSKQVTIYNANSAANGLLTIVARKCDATSTPYYVNLFVGSPPNPGVITRDGAETICGNSLYTFSVNPSPNTTSYDWYTSNGTIIYGQGASFVQIQMSPAYGTIPYPLYISVKARNDCGESSVSEYNSQVINCDNGGGPLSVYPNPANQSMIIQEDEFRTESDLKNDNKFEYKLYDKSGNIVSSGKRSNNNKVTIDTRELSSDTYFLHLIYKMKTIKKQIIIKH